MKKRIVSVLLTLCMAAALWPTAAFGAAAPTEFTDGGRNICANGTPIKIVAGTTANCTNILYDINGNGTIEDTEYLKIGSVDPTAAGYDLSGYRILGGVKDGSFTGDSNITIEGGYVGDVHGGNFSDNLTGDVTIVMNGGSVKRLLACGYWGKVGGSGKTASITITGGTVRGWDNDDIELNARIMSGTAKKLTITGGTINGTITSTVIPTNGAATPSNVCKTTLTLEDANGDTVTDTAVSDLTVMNGSDSCYAYGMKDVKTNGSGQLVVYLPAGMTVTGAAVGTAGYVSDGGITVLDTGEASGSLTKVLPKLLTVTAPSPKTLANAYDTAAAVIGGAELPSTVAVTAENGATALPCVWTFSGTYSTADGSTNTFHWAATATGYDVNGKTVSGDVSITNKAAPIPLTFAHSAGYDVPATTAGTAIAAIDVSGGAAGGTAPYTFSKVSGPGWLHVSAAGTVTGTPTDAAAATTAVVRVRDGADATRDITLAVGAVTAVPTEYTIHFHVNGGSGTVADRTTTDRKLASLPAAVKSGSYSLKGWYTAASGGTKITADHVFAGDTTVYAQWTYTGGGYSGYPVTEGAFVNFKTGCAAQFRIDHAANELVSVAVDGKTLTKGADYTVKSGSTVITLTSAFVKTLPNGTHGLYAAYKGGYASTYFTLSENGVVSAKTGDAGLALYAGMALVSSAGAVRVARRRRGGE